MEEKILESKIKAAVHNLVDGMLVLAEKVEHADFSDKIHWAYFALIAKGMQGEVCKMIKFLEEARREFKNE